MREELAEVEQELERHPAESPAGAGADPNTPRPAPAERLIDELGDLLFSVVNLTRKAGVEPGIALDRANAKFVRRFSEVERLAAERGLDVNEAGLEALDALWDEVKAGEHQSSCAKRRSHALRHAPFASLRVTVTHHGYNRWICRGNAIASRMCARPQIQATVRSMPSPKPECTKVP
jgi:NTP pyrophosphatase (non-canonical NTP hydrolase)